MQNNSFPAQNIVFSKHLAIFIDFLIEDLQQEVTLCKDENIKNKINFYYNNYLIKTGQNLWIN